MNSFLKKLFGTVNERQLKSFSSIVNKINDLEKTYSLMDDKTLSDQTSLLRTELKNGKKLDDILPQAFAIVREAAKRVLGQRHYDVQLIGGIVLHRGMISEMKTGEGKTLVSTLPAYLNALEEKGVHIVTVNDYLAKRDNEWMGKIFRFLNLSVECIVNGSTDEERKKAYQADITYSTNNELGFDYLRDNMRYSTEHITQRPFNYAIIDEVDSILIDESRTPLVISGPSEDRSDLYNVIDKVIYKISADLFEIDEKSRSINLNDEGITYVQGLCEKDKLIKKGSSLFDIENVNILHHTNQSLKAHHLFKKDVDYLVRNNQVLIIDEFTGRVMEGRRFSDGLHQALEAKENVIIQNENQTLASVTFQNYFRLYPKLSGMTGTGATEAREFEDIYKLHVLSIPTKNPVLRKDEDDMIYRTAKEKYAAIVDEIEKANKKKQPVLVGTISIEKSEYISSLLKKKKIPHNLLNAKHHEKEALTIAQAGRPGGVTIATNMAGRGTDIMLGGNPEMLALEKFKDPESTKYKKELEKLNAKVKEDKKISLKAGGLLVIGTERHESRRIDNQLRGRSGRMGDPGRSIFFLSLEDDLMRIFASEKMSSMLKKLGLQEGEAIVHPIISRTIEKAQLKVEGRNYEMRKTLLKFDDVMNDQRKVIYEQRHEIISQDNIHETVTDMYQAVHEEIIDIYMPAKNLKEEWDIDGFEKKLFSIYSTSFDIKTELEKDGIGNKEIQEYLDKHVESKLTQKRKDFGDQLYHTAEQRILLITIDQLWKDHLLSLDHLRSGIYLRALGQRDPLNEYKKEAFDSFSNMLSAIKESFISRIMRMEIDIEEEHEMLSKEFEPDTLMHESRNDPALHGSIIEGQESKNNNVHPSERSSKDPRTWGKVGRNETCPCNSGKKYKHCHGKLS
ncbi:MAG: preprotein translocase subunit SecA [Alphaproteobacteria bacterium]|nr:preprotein translocase subunit SecA [Alphaproteobacteria bacterium]